MKAIQCVEWEMVLPGNKSWSCEMAHIEKHQGGCMCGAIRYEVTGIPVWSAGCCCESCVKAIGAPVVVWSGFRKADFQILKGTQAEYESSHGIKRGFCGKCGTSLTYRKSPAAIRGAQDDVYVSTVTFDAPEKFPPTEHVYYGERADWFELGGNTPRHDTTSPQNAHRQLAFMSRE
jgi:hypothetical protein